MSAFIVDSDGLISYEHRNPAVMDLLDGLYAQGHVLGSCGVTIAEFYSGRDRGADRSIDAFVDTLTYWPIEFEDAVQAGRWRFEYRRAGIQLTATDMLIAAVAKRVGATVITGNVKDFPMDDVTVQSLLG